LFPRLLAENILNAIDSLNWGTSFLNTMISMQLPKGPDGRSDNSDSSLTANIGDFVNPNIVEKHDGKGETDGVDPEG
jgi:hypothetical protein